MKASKCPSCTASVPVDDESCPHCGTYLVHDECTSINIRTIRLERSTLTADNVEVIGSRNIITGNNVFVRGERNRVYGKFVLMEGDRNEHYPAPGPKYIEDKEGAQEATSEEMQHAEVITIIAVLVFFLLLIYMGLTK